MSPGVNASLLVFLVQLEKPGPLGSGRLAPGRGGRFLMEMVRRGGKGVASLHQQTRAASRG